MPSIRFQFVLLVGMLTQSTTPVRTGFVTELTEEDLSAIRMLVPESPWLLNGEVGFAGRQFVNAYLPPTTANSVLQRGVLIPVSRRMLDPRTNKPTGWTVERAEQYAQVAIPGRKFDRIQSNLDINLPFRVIDHFDDVELVALVLFLRSNSSSRGEPTTTVQPWPILSVNRQNDGSVRVMLLEKAMQGQAIILRRNGQTWTIVSIGIWAA